MTRKSIALAVAAALGGAAFAPAASAGGVTYKDGDKYMKLGGRIQLQYHQVDPDGADSTDELFFRRFRPYIEGSVHPDWKGKFQFDLGKAEDANEVAVKDAYMQYSGYDNVKVKIGNANFPFSREFLTSSKKQHLVERTFVGDHNYGTPDRNAGVHVSGHGADRMWTWAASVAQASVDPSDSKLDFDTPINRNSDFNEGWIFGGRVDFHPFGYLKFSQGDFKREQKATVSVAAFRWSNDDDVINAAAGKADVDSVSGVELSGAYRSAGFSIDAEVNSFDADLVDGTITNGIYQDGTTTLDNYSIEGGYMVIPDRLEVVAGLSSQDADNYAETWDRTEFGVNWFVHKHDIKYQLTMRQNENIDGTVGNDSDELFLQAQYVF